MMLVYNPQWAPGSTACTLRDEGNGDGTICIYMCVHACILIVHIRFCIITQAQAS